MMENQNIQYVFLDSGIGGIPYLKYLRQTEPNASCAYIADIEHFPYGEKKLDEVIRFSRRIVEKIICKFNPKVIIIACNTISVSSLACLRKEFDVPFVGTVPAIKPAASLSKNKKIALLATERTINDIYTQNLIEEFGAGCKFFMRADPRLIIRIEEDLPNASRSDKIKAVEPAIEFFRSTGADTAVLGCTHFLHLQDIFKTECFPDIRIVDSLDGVVKQALNISPLDKSYKSNTTCGFYVTLNNPAVQKKYLAYTSFFNMQLKFL